jgi:hypothetical protein
MLEGETELSPADLIRQQLVQLEKKRGNAIKPEDWTAADRATLLSLQQQLSNLGPTAERFDPKLGKRQSEAGTVVNGVRQPPLTQQEQGQIVNSIRSTANQGQRGK